MSSVFCRGCGQPVSATASTCPNCGATQSSRQSQATKEDTGPNAKWQRRFALITKAGGPKLGSLSKLAMSERLAVKFNVWGFFFGPFYYAFLGMWKRALSLFGAGIAIILVGQVILNAIGANQALASFFVAGFYAGKVNVDYFKKQVLNDNGWW